MNRHISEFLSPELSKKAGIVNMGGSLDPLITGLEYDSRKAAPGRLYFAFRGLHTDGHRFIDDAIMRGAQAVVYEDDPPSFNKDTLYLKAKDSRLAMSSMADAFFGQPSRSLAVVGVTGTEGKSTTVYLIYQLLKLAGKKAGFVSTVEHDLGEGEKPNPEHQTTPEASVVQQQLALMADAGLEYAVVEASSHGLSEKTARLKDVAFDVGVMTNVTHEHLEFHGTWEQYRSDKAQLFRGLDAPTHNKAVWGTQRSREVPCFGVVNRDDRSAAYFIEAAAAPVYTFSTIASPADLSVREIESRTSGSAYKVKVLSNGKTITVEDRLPGAFNAGNVLAALLVVSGLLAVPVEDLIPFVQQLRPVRGRMTAVGLGQPFRIFVDYAHTPSSFETVLPTLSREVHAEGGRLISLFGSAGERDIQKRAVQGRIASEWSDIVILTDEDPRGEIPMDILRQIAAGCEGHTEGTDLFLIPDRPEAIRAAFNLARPNDTVILLGKGHENSIIYNDRVMPFDEIAEAESALGEMGFMV